MSTGQRSSRPPVLSVKPVSFLTLPHSIDWEDAKIEAAVPAYYRGTERKPRVSWRNGGVHLQHVLRNLGLAPLVDPMYSVFTQ